MKRKQLLIVVAVFFLLVVLHAIFLIKPPVVTKWFTYDDPRNAYWMDGPFIYGQYQVTPYTNRTWWGYYGGTNRCWGIYTHAHWPFITKEWILTTVDSNGVWHTP